MYPEEEDDLNHIENEQTRKAIKDMNTQKDHGSGIYYPTHMSFVGTY